jgi:hypothetical protein
MAVPANADLVVQMSAVMTALAARIDAMWQIDLLMRIATSWV